MPYPRRKGTHKISRAMARAVALERNSYRSDISPQRAEQLRREARRLRQQDAAAKAFSQRAKTEGR